MQDLNTVDIQVEVGGTPVNFANLELFQTMSGHHRFSVEVSYRVSEKSVWTVMPERIYEQLGEKLAIQFSHKVSGEKTDFVGVITNIDIGGADGDQGYVVLHGGSPTLLFDMDESTDSYVEQTLHNIVMDVAKKLGVEVTIDNNPTHDRIIPYAARYKETSWNFISRLASSCGEWLFYDGKKLVVGNPKNNTEVNGIYDLELKQIKISSRLENLNRWIYDYNSVHNEYWPSLAEDTNTGMNSFSRVAKSKSESLFPTITNVPSPRAAITTTDIDEQMRGENSRNLQQMAVFTATTDTCAIRLGEMVVTQIPKSLQVNVGPDLGRYRVIEIHHKVGADGRYSNTFKGVPGMTQSMPWGDVKIPVAFPEPATIVDNNDPEKQGRVKAKFFWQDDVSNSTTTGWMRVQTPDAGVSDNVKKNRGFFFVPELGDQVMVAFERGDPSRPYVSGSLFHGGNSGGIAPENSVKSITTRSGHTIEFNDDEKVGTPTAGSSWGITITDRKINIIHIDTANDSIRIEANKNIDITASETMTLNAKTLNINIQEDMTTTVGGDQKTTVSGKVENSENELKETIAQDAKIEVGQKLSQLVGKADIIASSGDILIKSAGKALVQGAVDARISKG